MPEQLFAFGSNLAIAAWLGLGCAAALGQGPWRERLLFVAGRVVLLALICSETCYQFNEKPMARKLTFYG